MPLNQQLDHTTGFYTSWPSGTALSGTEREDGFSRWFIAKSSRLRYERGCFHTYLIRQGETDFIA